MTKEKSKRFPVGRYIASISLLLTSITLIMAIYASNEEKPDLHYSYALSHYEAPDGIDAQLFTDFLIENNIGPHHLSIQIKNSGNAPVKKIKMSVNTPDSMVCCSYTPSQKDNIAWVVLPTDKELAFKVGTRKIAQELIDLAPNKTLVFDVSYKGESQAMPEIQIFGDVIEATFIKNINDLKKWSPYRVFLMPTYIFVGGLLLVLLCSICSVIYSNPVYRNAIKEMARSMQYDVSGSLRSVSPYSDLYSIIQFLRRRFGTEEKDEIKDEKNQSRSIVQPARTGKSWTAKESSKLRKQFENDKSIELIAEEHQRTKRAIRSKLIQLGLMDSK